MIGITFITNLAFYFVFLQMYIDPDQTVTISINSFNEAVFEVLLLSIIMIGGLLAFILVGLDYVVTDERSPKLFVVSCIFIIPLTGIIMVAGNAILYLVI